MELAFVLPPRQSRFLRELVDALRHEADVAGAQTSLHVGNFPAPRRDLVYVLTRPHEYFANLGGRHGPLPEVLKRTILICAEQPNTPSFDNDLHLAPMGGAVFNLNRFGVRALTREGVAAHHLQLGWTRGWDHHDGRERDIDVLFIGSHTDRRARILGEMAPILSRYRTHLVLSDTTRPTWAPSANFLDDGAKWDLLCRARLLVNIHQEGNPYLEWLRVVQAMSSGAVIVSEHSVDYAPLVAGEHVMLGDSGSLGLMCELLLQDHDRRSEMQTIAYRMVREQLPLATAAQALVHTGEELARGAPIAHPRHRFFTQPEPDPEELPAAFTPFEPASPAGGDAETALIRRELKHVRLQLLELQRVQAHRDLEATTRGPVPRLEAVAQTTAYAASTPRVSVITALYDHGIHIEAALSSAALANDVNHELVIVDDASTDGSAETVVDWMRRHQDVPALLVRHAVNRGLATTRNDALGLARGELSFVLDADNEIYPHCLGRLVDALDADPGAAFAYGTLEMFAGEDCVGLMNPFPWDPARLRAGNYIDAMALLRTAVARDEMGGYPTDPRLYGWEDYALWCAMASAGHRGVRVPEILARYRVSQDSMLSMSNISVTEAFSAIIEANPTLMAGIEAPA